jgi:hypothetical protein
VTGETRGHKPCDVWAFAVEAKLAAVVARRTTRVAVVVLRKIIVVVLLCGNGENGGDTKWRYVGSFVGYEKLYNNINIYYDENDYDVHVPSVGENFFR